MARSIAPSFEGSSISFPANVNAGESVISNYSFTLPSDWDENNMHIVGLLISPDGRIDNAASTSITEAVSNGYEEGSNVGVFDGFNDQIDDKLKVFPNPASTILNVTVDIFKSNSNQLRIFNAQGQLVKDFEMIESSGSWSYQVDISDFSPGVYAISYTSDNGNKMKRFVVE